MNKELSRTLIYLGVCAASLALGFFTWSSNKPREIDDYALVGEEFYPDFNNPNDATSLEVTVFDEDKATISDFQVEFKDGFWRIPSHFNYPADAKEQLAKTAASIIGIKRAALVSRLESDQVKYAVIDPKLQDPSKLKGRGSRITLKKGSEILADYIIGSAHKDRAGHYYVRSPEEKETYLAQFSVDLSTKFQDWIDTDLLKIEQDKLTDIIVNKYTIDEREGRLTNVDVTEIHRDKFGEAWQIADIDPEVLEVNSEAVKNLVSALVETSILGVRPKPEGLTPDLGVTREAAQNPILMSNIRGDLAEKGFFLTQARENGPLQVIAKEGSFYAATNEGLMYELHFGEVFTGSLKEIETGLSAKSENPEGEKSGEPDAESQESANSSGQQKQSRYLFVKVSYDPQFLGPEPVKPEPPEEPEASSPDDPLRASKPDETAKTDPVANFEILTKAYEDDLKKYEEEVKKREERSNQGIKLADELNQRLGAWYYVISAENVDNLRVSREKLVQPVGTEKKEGESESTPEFPEEISLPPIPPELRLPV
ncbi:MAG TPA: DUF4340 domain-containing protein, partial [Planctomycetaceae bacterium]|nr:DUF4340 domain-containing protein [Planctomycetaceae bacterium]